MNSAQARWVLVFGMSFVGAVFALLNIIGRGPTTVTSGAVGLFVLVCVMVNSVIHIVRNH